MLISKAIAVFLIGFLMGFCLKKWTWLRCLFFLGLLSLSILFTWFVIAILFSAVFSFDVSYIIMIGAFSVGAYVGYRITRVE